MDRSEQLLNEYNIYKQGVTPEQVDAGLTNAQLYENRSDADNYTYGTKEQFEVKNELQAPEPAPEHKEETPAKNLAFEKIGQSIEFKDNSLSGIGAYEELDDNISLQEATKLAINSENARIKEVKDLSQKLNLPENVISFSHETMDKAREVARQIDRRNIPTPEELEKYYPGFKELAKKDTAAAALALKELKNVKVAHGIIDNFITGLKEDTINAKRSAIGRKAFYGDKLTDEDNRELERLETEAIEKFSAMADDDFFDAMAAGLASNGKMMLRQMINPDGAYAAGMATMIEAGLKMRSEGNMLPINAMAVGTSVLGVNATGMGTGSRIVSALMQSAPRGINVGVKTGAIVGMFKDSVGDYYLDFKNYKDDRGNQLLTDNQARFYAALSAGFETGIEFYNYDEWVKLLGGSGKNKAALELIKDMIKDSKDPENFKMLASAAFDKLKKGGKIAAEEDFEEVTQSLASDAVTNLASANNPGGDIPSYTAGEMLVRAVEEGWNAAPTTVAFGVLGVSGSSFKGVRNIVNFIQKPNDIAHQTVRTARVNAAVNALAESKEVQEFIKENPEGAEAIIEGQLKEQGSDYTYIDTELLLETEEGKEVFNQIASENYTQEEIDNIKSYNGPLTIPTYKYIKLDRATRERLNDYVSFDEAADCFARNQKEVRRQLAIANKTVTKSIEQIEQGVDAAVNEYFEKDEERFLAKDIILSDLEAAPGKALRMKLSELKTELNTIIAPTIEQLKLGMGNGVGLAFGMFDDETRGIRVSNNDAWYSRFYKDYGRAPHKAELMDIAIANMTYSPTDYQMPEYAGVDLDQWAEQDPEGFQELENLRDKLANLQHEIEMLEDMKERMDGITLDEINAAMEFTEPVMEVYRQIMPVAKKSTNKKTTQSAAMSVLVFCSHLQAFVEILHNSGYKNYTPIDYFMANPVVFDFDGNEEHVWDSRKVYGVGSAANVTNEGTFNMPLREEDRIILKINGRDEFAVIREYMTEEGILLPTAPVSLYIGYQVVNSDTYKKEGGFGLRHLIYGHEDYIKSMGYIKNGEADVERLINDVMGTPDVIHISKEKHEGIPKILVSKKILPKKAIALVIAYDKSKKKYSIATVRPLTGNSLKNLDKNNEKAEMSISVHPNEQTQQPAAAPLSYPDGTKSGTTERPFKGKGIDTSALNDILANEIRSVKDNIIYKTQKEIDENRKKRQSFNQLAYHGSPHKFDKFDLGAIGTGEGRQAHGWGLYFAKNREISEGYKEKLSKKHVTHKGEKVERENKTLWPIAERYYISGKHFYGFEYTISSLIDVIGENARKGSSTIRRFNKLFKEYQSGNIAIYDLEYEMEYDDVLEDLYNEGQEILNSLPKEEYNNMTDSEIAEVYISELNKVKEKTKRYRKEIKELKQLNPDDFKIEIDSDATLFEVDIPDDDVLLDEQKQLNEQPEAVRKAIYEYFKQHQDKHILPENYNDLGSSIGRQFLKEVEHDLKQKGSVTPEKDASLLLNSLGIKGITYNGLRDGRCFVVFDDKAVDIIETYNQAASMTSPAEIRSVKDNIIYKTQKEIDEDSKKRQSFNQLAYHGSPHVFDKFDLGAIGTGEGAQAHGWGLYFAKNKKTAEIYREKLSKRGWNIFYDGKLLDKTDPIAYAVMSHSGNTLYKAAHGDTEEFIKVWQGAPVTYEESYGKASFKGKIIDNLEEALKYIESNPKISITSFLKADVAQEELYRYESILKSVRRKAKEEGRRANINDFKNAIQDHLQPFLKEREYYLQQVEIHRTTDPTKIEIKNPGTLFEVDVPEDDVLLDEQKKLSEQPEPVRKAIYEYYKQHEEHYILPEDYNDLGSSTGKQFLKEVQLDLKQKGSVTPEKDASLLLNSLGIKGITYNGLRDGRCFVVFDDKAISVIESYKQAASMTSPAVRGSTIIAGGVRTIKLFETANQSTFIHECAHLFFDDLERLYNTEGITPQARKDWNELNKWCSWYDGILKEYEGTAVYKEFEQMDRAIREARLNGSAELGGKTYTLAQLEKRWKQERFARGFEQYLKGGKAPTKGLRAAFNKFCNWLKTIYSHFRAVGAEPSKDVKEIMDRLIATQDAIDDAFGMEEYDELVKTGALKYFSGNEKQMWALIQQEAKDAVYEKVLKIAMKDLRDKEQEEFKQNVEEGREYAREMLRNVPAFIVEKIVKDNKEISVKDAYLAAGVTEKEYKQQIKEYGPTFESAVERWTENYKEQLRNEQKNLPALKERARAILAESHYQELLTAFELEAMQQRLRTEQALTKKLAKLSGADKAQRAHEIKRRARMQAFKDAIAEVKAELKDKRKRELANDEAHFSDILKEHPAYKVARLLENQPNISVAEACKIIGCSEEEYNKAIATYGPTLKDAVKWWMKEAEKTEKEFGFGPTKEQIKAMAASRMETEEYKRLIAQYELELANVDVKTPLDKAIENLDKHRKEKTFVERGVRLMRDAAKGQVEAIRKAAIKKINELTLKDAANPAIFQKRAADENEKALAAMAKKDFVQAAKHKQYQLGFNIMCGIAYGYKETVESFDKLLKARSERLRTVANLAAEERYIYCHMLYVLGYTNKDVPLPQERGFNNPREVFDYVMNLHKDATAKYFMDEENGGYSLSAKLIDAIYDRSQIKGGLKAFTMPELKEIKQLMACIYKLGGERHKLKTLKDADGDVLDYDKVLDEVTEIMIHGNKYNEDKTGASGSPSPKELVLDKLDKYHVSLIKMENLLNAAYPRLVDIIYTPIKRAMDNYTLQMQNLEKSQKAIWNAYWEEKSKGSNLKLGKLQAEFYGKKQYQLGTSKITHENLIVLALNMGTELNAKRILDGFQLPREAVMTALQDLDDADWDLIHSIWATFDNYWGELRGTQERMTGIVMEKQEATQFRVHGKDGKTHIALGGYFPITYNPWQGVSMANIEQNEMNKMLSDNFNVRSGARMGGTKARVEGKVEGKKILLDLTGMTRQLENTIAIITLRETLSDVDKLVKNERFGTAFTARMGRNAYSELQKWLADIWAPSPNKKGFEETLMAVTRTGSVAAALAFNANVAMLNINNMYLAMEYLGNGSKKRGVIRFVEALRKYYSNPEMYHDLVMQKSIFIETRENNVDPDVAYKKANQTTLDKFHEFVNDKGFWLASVTDKMVMLPMWISEYERVYKEKLDENFLSDAEDVELAKKREEYTADQESFERVFTKKYKRRTIEQIELAAIDAGDKAVRTTFGSSREMDKAGVQRDRSEVTKMFTMYYSFFSLMHNALYNGFQGYKQNRKLSKTFNRKGLVQWFKDAKPLMDKILMFFALPALQETLLRALTSTDGDDKELEDYGKEFISTFGSQLVGGLPVIRDLMPMFLGKILGTEYYGLRTNSIYEEANAIMSLWKKIESDKSDKVDVLRAGSKFANTALGSPRALSNAVANTLDFIDHGELDFEDIRHYVLTTIFAKDFDRGR